MGKTIRCCDVGLDCDFSAWGETEEELLELVALHAREAHGVTEMGPDLEAKVRRAMRDS